MIVMQLPSPSLRRIRRRRRDAFTLVELLLALTISALVSAGVAAMMVAVSYGSSSDRDMRGLLVKSRTIDARINAAIRSSRTILETGTDYLVLWMADTRQNDAPNLSEIRLIERNGSDELNSYKADFPDGWSEEQIEAADTQYQVSDDFLAATTAAKATGYFPASLWATDVTAIEFVLDTADPTTTKLASYRVTLQDGDMTETAIGAASLRSRTVQASSGG